MIFSDKLKEIEKILSPELDKTFDLAMKNQSHPGDLLLIYINGFYRADTIELNKRLNQNLNPHVIGPNHEGWSEQTHYSFIHKYRTTNISKLLLPEYLKLHVYTPERRAEIDELVNIEETTIQLEMLIYLKFWEADSIIKKFYQFVRLLNGEHYDWYFKIQESSRDKGATGSRQDLIRLKIRDRLKDISPVFYKTIKETYLTQIRNSIAHSNYSTTSRHIHPNNYIADDPASQLKVVSFDQWIDIFHNTLILHNEYIRLNNRINETYRELAKKNNNEIEIRVTEENGKQYPLIVTYREEWNDWRFKQNDE
ncbi:MAG: hypothetical protein ABJH04_21380 [Cyclobacteriaceae bacterium]